MAGKEETKERFRSDLKEPKRYQVVMHNDDYTPMEFVVMVLVQVFKKKQKEAIGLMLMVHKSQHAVVGSYSYDIAMTKVTLVTSMANEEGFPFRLSIEEV